MKEKKSMQVSKLETSLTLSRVIAALVIIASFGGLFLQRLYRDNDFIARLWQGNDAVTLFVAAPMLLFSMFLTKRGSLRALLVWFGVLSFTLYNYAFYLFAAAFNWFFWIYVAIFSLTIFALIFGFSSIDAEAIKKQFSSRTPLRGISIFIAAFSCLMGGMWIIRSLSFFTTGEVPQDIVQTGHPTGVVYALDLSLVVPWMLLSAVWLWQRKAWGYVLTVMLLVKGFTYPLALVVMSVISSLAGTGYDPLTPFYALLGVGCLTACVSLLANLDAGNRVEECVYA
jgi:hypothetical protein